MAAGSELRCHFDQVQTDGSGASELLTAWIKVIKNIPLDDSVAESPHASGNRLGRHGSASSFAWVASSMRLVQNLDDVRDHCHALREDLEELWYAHSSLLQTQRKRLHRPLRCKPQVYRQQLYELGRFVPPLCHATGDGGDEDQDAANDSAAEAQVLHKAYSSLKGFQNVLTNPL